MHFLIENAKNIESRSLGIPKYLAFSESSYLAKLMVYCWWLNDNFNMLLSPLQTASSKHKTLSSSLNLLSLFLFLTNMDTPIIYKAKFQMCLLTLKNS